MFEDSLLLTACGSNGFGLETHESDHDYIALVSPGDYPDLPLDTATKQRVGDTDYFLHRLDAMTSLPYCTSPLIAPYYGNGTTGTCSTLREFWARNAAALMDLAPGLTYDAALRDTGWYLDNEYEHGYHVAARHIGLLMCRYETGSMAEAVKLNELWRERYFAVKNGTAGLPELREWLAQATTDEVRTYFESQPVNTALFEEYRALVEHILA